MIKLLTYSLIKSETGPMHALGADLEKFQSTHSYRVRLRFYVKKEYNSSFFIKSPLYFTIYYF